MKSNEAMTAQERTREHRKERLAAGWRQINVWLDPQASLALNEIIRRHKIRGTEKTQRDVISEALLDLKGLSLGKSYKELISG